MKIGIDARLWDETGVGRYIRALVRQLGADDTQNDYTLFLKKKHFDSVRVPNVNWRKILADISWHTFEEQIKMPAIYKNAKLDLIHIPYFSVPLFIQTPYVVTIHDLTLSHFATGKATTKSLPEYFLKQIGYRLMMHISTKRARHIITVSHDVKKQLMAEYNLSTDQVSVIYEAGNLESIQLKKGVENIPKYILYVGNAHPHKNIYKLIEAYELIKKTYPELALVLIGKTDFFYKKLQNFVQQKKISGVHFLGEVTNGELATWYTRAKVFVFPSLSEGFGIPGLEAMSIGCPVVASDIQVFHEIYRDAAAYFNPRSEVSISDMILSVLQNARLRNELINKGKIRAHYFSWNKMANETRVVYENCVRL